MLDSKSQIAIRFAYILQGHAPGTSIFWVHGGTFVQFRKSFQTVADKCEIPGRDTPKSDTLQIVHDWLLDKAHGRWLMIIDNADDASLFYQTSGGQQSNASTHTRRLAEYLPDCAHGCLLFTTRDRSAAEELTFHRNTLQVDKMTEGEAADLLIKIFNRSDNQDGISQLAKRLEYLPLALYQAASYIQTQRMDIAKYLRYMESDPVGLLDKAVHAAGRPSDVPHALASSWLITFKHLRTHHYIAAKLFALISCLDPHRIPRSLFLGTGRKPLELDEALQVLVSFSLITLRFDVTEYPDGYKSDLDVEESCFDMHPLVRLVTQEWLKKENQLQQTINDMLSIFNKSYPNPWARISWTRFELYEAHVETVLQATLHSENRVSHYELLSKRARVLGAFSRDVEAMACLKRIVEMAPAVYGPDHVVTSYAEIEYLTELCKDRNQVTNCLKRLNKILDRAIQIHGPNHDATLKCLLVVAQCHRTMTHYEESLLLATFILDRENESTRPDQVFQIWLENSLAQDLLNLREYDKAEDLIKVYLQSRRTHYGEEHWYTLFSMSMLAELYHWSGRHSEAERMALERIHIVERIYGPKHHLTLDGTQGIARICLDQDRYVEAARHLETLMAASVQALGAKTLQNLNIKSQLAATYLLQGRTTEAIALGSEARDLVNEVLGPSSAYAQACSWRLDQWKDEDLRSTYIKEWRAGSTDRRNITGFRTTPPEYSDESPKGTEEDSVLKVTHRLVDIVLRGRVRSSFSFMVWGTLNARRRFKKKTWARHQELAPRTNEERRLREEWVWKDPVKWYQVKIN
ncbi:MAG: hypothetical protein M1820_007490 [Bogoriella megaspora]|nr:MAG: hypothetical protein M1820_007490 [Bogoriella megaspora]